ncbi:MAG: hypothetical protein LBF32_04230 [Streptococcaceae bacterium]|jgi:hypothetical protein|nr:hypothetical protein [Streptococcaceae bacterium]
MSIFCCVFVFSNVITLAVPVQTTYQPWNGVVAGGSDPFGEQGTYPWCLMLCMKMVLRDIHDKNTGGMAVPAVVNVGRITTLMSLPDPDPAHAADRLIIQEELVKELLLDYKTIINYPFIPTTVTVVELGAFDNALNNFFRNQLGHFSDECKGWLNAIGRKCCCSPRNGCMDADLCIEVQNLNIYRKEHLLDGLLACAPRAKLTSLWNDLGTGATRSLRRSIIGESTDVVTNMINRITDNGGGNGIQATVRNLLDAHGAIHGGQYQVALQVILNELNTRRMAVINLRNPANHNERHSCVAYAGEFMGGALPGLAAAALGVPGEEINIFNPWGDTFVLDNVNPEPNCDMAPNLAPGSNMKIYEYITFTY